MPPKRAALNTQAQRLQSMEATKFNAKRLNFHREMAKAYHGFLTYTFIQNAGNTDLHRGLAEFRNKFLSCYYIESEHTPVPEWFQGEILTRYKGSNRRYLRGDYYSEAALRVIGGPRLASNELRFEHILPKGEAIKDACEAGFKKGDPIAVEAIAQLLDERGHIAVITKVEHDMLRTHRKMPKDFPSNLFARYRDDNGGMLFPLLRSIEEGVHCKTLLSSAVTIALELG
ncbi:hypothetical protein JYK21_13410 [Ralstonia pickettii]|nr:hypothetical protein [Ralstonia pickettii]